MNRKILSAGAVVAAVTILSTLLISSERSDLADNGTRKNEQIKELQDEKAMLEARLKEVEAQLKKLQGMTDAGKVLEETARELKFYGTALRLTKSEGVRAEWSS